MKFLYIDILIVFLGIVSIHSKSFRGDNHETDASMLSSVTSLESMLEKTLKAATDDAGDSVEDDDKTPVLDDEASAADGDASGDVDDYYYDPKNKLEEGEEADVADADDTADDSADDKNDDENTERRKLQNKWATFKSYQNTPKKPWQYASRQTKHTMSEYLSPNQKFMLQERNGPDDPNHSFTDNWSGFDKKQN